jgi:hypothetical protein
MARQQVPAGSDTRFPVAAIAVIEGGMVPLMEQRPAEVAEVIPEFLP